MRTFLNNLPVNKAEDGSFKVLGGLSEWHVQSVGAWGPQHWKAHPVLGRTILPWSGGGRSPCGRSRPPGPGPLACADPRGPPGMPCVVCRQGWGGLLAGESGLSGPLSLLGFRERKQDRADHPLEGVLLGRQGWVHGTGRGSGGPGACG